jgi:D-arabinose 1-dehydrogenase-like Zn-dependent alcohol dehydrogenase
MRALVYESFGGPMVVREEPAPTAAPGGVVIRVGASGVCRSDWHGWQGHDPDISLPHVPGHELAGTVEAVGAGVRGWQVGARVTVPFVCACGRCARCAAGDQQVCEHQTQPGFTHWGSFAELVSIEAADVNLVALPDALSFAVAASLGCRYGTAFRAVVHQGKVRPGEWVAVHGCGGVGLSAVQVAVAAGARVVALDVAPGALALARELGAQETVDSRGLDTAAVAGVVQTVTAGGAHLSLDALGSPGTCVGSVSCLRARGRHVQVGLLPPELGRPEVPMDRVVALELELLGSHGMPAHAYPEMLGLIASGRLQPERLITRDLALDEAGAAFADLGAVPGIAVVTRF